MVAVPWRGNRPSFFLCVPAPTPKQLRGRSYLQGPEASRSPHWLALCPISLPFVFTNPSITHVFRFQPRPLSDAGSGLLRPRCVGCMIDLLSLQASWRAGCPSLFQLCPGSLLGNGACSCLPNRTLAPHYGDAWPSPPAQPPSPEQVLLPRCLSFLGTDI